MMTWEETIEHIRDKEEYKELVEQAYFEKDLTLNVIRFETSEEFKETLKIIKEHAADAKTILDIGAGNGISSVSFAKLNYQVYSVEPDPSNTIGTGAIKQLKNQLQLNTLNVYESFAEEINFEAEFFDIVYVRQAMHHANDLKKFLKECGRVLKKGGLLLTVRDHVIFNEKDKEWFLESHPLHHFYGGENAFTKEEYRNAITDAGIEIKKELKHYDSPINYFPETLESAKKKRKTKKEQIVKRLKSKIGFLAQIGVVQNMYFNRVGFSPSKELDEEEVPGRMYSFVGIKK